MNAPPDPITCAVARGEVDPRAEMRAKPLWIGARHQGCRFQNVAVDQAERSRIVLIAHRVKQQRAVDAVDGNADVRRPQAADCELRSKVVSGGDRRQDLCGAKGIVGDQPPQREKIAAAEHGLRGHTGLRLSKRARRYRDVFNVGAGTFGDGNRDVDHLVGGDDDVATNEAETNYRDDERSRTGGNVSDLEAAVFIRERLLSGGLHLDQDRRERRAGARFDDGAGHAARHRLRVRVQRK